MMGLKVKDLGDEPSLLPYLNSLHGRFYINFSMITQDAAILEKTPFPFLVIADSDPLTCLIEGQVLTDTESEVKKIFLLKQKDQYRLTREELWPVNNRDVHDFWQKAFSFYVKEKKDSSLIILANQIDEKGELRALQPLFFCKTRKLFFPPPCPKCGLSLHQCEDDDLLIHSGLQPYSTSLKRYLYCPSCSLEGKSNFYVYELDYSDPPGLKDRLALIKEFSLLLKNKNIHDHFPCSGCPNDQVCYESDQRVLARIHPFSFYPFYMLVFEAMSLNGLDFLSLLSGATFDELEAQLEIRREVGRLSYLKTIKQNGRVKAPFFYDHSERYFLEVLYLKLSFLGEVFQNFLHETDLFKHPDLRLSIDRIWVKLEADGSLLPFFWNFRVGFLDISRHLTEIESLPKGPASFTLFFLALIWFYTLLGNKKQNISIISISIRESLEHPFADQNFSNPFFNPTNIFWDPEGKNVDKTCLPLWEKSLHLGWSLFKASFQYDSQWSKGEFWNQLDHLRSEVKSNLFEKESMESLPTRPSERIGENEAIYAILTRILRKWDAEKEKEKEEKEIISETVIIRPQRAGLDFEEKVLVKEVDKISSSRETVELPQGNDFLAETVILGPGKEASIFQRVQSKGSGFEKKEVSTELKTEGTLKTREEPKEGDFLAETVILGPGKGGDKGKDGTKG